MKSFEYVRDDPCKDVSEEGLNMYFARELFIILLF